MLITKHATAHWQGGLRDGRGSLSTESGALRDTPYGFRSRFEGQPGSNPEELLAAAHAGCFTMALAMQLGLAGMSAESLETRAEVTLEQDEGGFTISAVHLALRAHVPGAERAAFESAVEAAKTGCPVSRLLDAEITLEASLQN
ncbi:OsmC family protein [Zestomonas thermotolerans]|jgi:osmotically inducible protein OsmC|uniref:OsmC family protein n=1 Tax=Zestomonas thermotolerans TaxID=157784 RepID=UPI00037BF3EF